MIGSRVESGLELRFLELGGTKLWGVNLGGRHLLGSRFSKVPFDHKEGLEIS